jgi:hypothetical protein
VQLWRRCVCYEREPAPWIRSPRHSRFPLVPPTPTAPAHSVYAVPLLGPVANFDGSKLGFGLLMDGIYNGISLTNVDLMTVWSANAAYEHLWNPQWRTSVYTGILGEVT